MSDNDKLLDKIARKKTFITSLVEAIHRKENELRYQQIVLKKLQGELGKISRPTSDTRSEQTTKGCEPCC